MEPKPLPQHEQPRYPTRREVLAGAASFALVNLAGCNVAVAESEAGKVTVAPIFPHGEGRGATGCVVISPPVFLSEEEGVQILREELAKHGIQLKAGATLKGVRVPARIVMTESVNKVGEKPEFKRSLVEVPDRAKPLKLSGVDPEKKIAVEFVSHDDYFDLGGPMSGSTVQGYDFKDAAGHVAALVKQQGKIPAFLGVFYDPAAKIPVAERSKEDAATDRSQRIENWQKRMEQGKAESKKLLRQQAQDFVAWLKEQKAIP